MRSPLSSLQPLSRAPQGRNLLRKQLAKTEYDLQSIPEHHKWKTAGFRAGGHSLLLQQADRTLPGDQRRHPSQVGDIRCQEEADGI